MFVQFENFNSIVITVLVSPLRAPTQHKQVLEAQFRSTHLNNIFPWKYFACVVSQEDAEVSFLDGLNVNVFWMI